MDEIIFKGIDYCHAKNMPINLNLFMSTCYNLIAQIDAFFYAENRPIFFTFHGEETPEKINF